MASTTPWSRVKSTKVTNLLGNSLASLTKEGHRSCKKQIASKSMNSRLPSFYIRVIGRRRTKKCCLRSRWRRLTQTRWLKNANQQRLWDLKSTTMGIKKFKTRVSLRLSESRRRILKLVNSHHLKLQRYHKFSLRKIYQWWSPSFNLQSQSIIMIKITI